MHPTCWPNCAWRRRNVHGGRQGCLFECYQDFSLPPCSIGPSCWFVPPFVEKKQKKRKNKSKGKRHDAPERTPKAKTLAEDVSNSGGKALVSHDLEFHKGVNVFLTQTENEVLLSSFKGGDFMTDLLELQVRAMVAVRLLAHESSQESFKELEDWRLRLADARGALKKAIEAKFALTDQVNKLTAEVSASKFDMSKLEARCGELERKEVELMANMSCQHEELHGVIQERDGRTRLLPSLNKKWLPLRTVS